MIVGSIIEWTSNDEEPSEIMSSDFTYMLQCGVAVGVHGESYQQHQQSHSRQKW